jgi:hypothetical protein
MKMAELWRRKRRLALRPKGSVGEQMRKKKEEEEKEEEEKMLQRFRKWRALLDLRKRQEKAKEEEEKRKKAYTQKIERLLQSLDEGE